MGACLVYFAAAYPSHCVDKGGIMTAPRPHCQFELMLMQRCGCNIPFVCICKTLLWQCLGAKPGPG